MPRRDFVSIPPIPDTGDDGLTKVLLAMQENIELLAGLRGADGNHAVVKGDIEVDYPADITSGSVDEIQALKETVRKLMVNLKVHS